MRSSFFVGLVLAALLPAQSIVTSPAGLANREGNTSSSLTLFARPGMRWQQLDSTLRGAPIANLRSIAWRRDGGLANPAFVSRTVDLEVVLAHTTLTRIRPDFAMNYTGAPTTVFARRPVNLPDWTATGSGGPEPWSIVAPFDQTWSYNGSNDLLWEVRYASNSAVPSGTSSTTYGNDFELVPGSFANGTSGTTVTRSACVATGRTSAMAMFGTFYNHGTKFRLQHAISNAPSNVFVAINLDVLDSNQIIAGLCHILHVLPVITYAIGPSSATGDVPFITLDNLPHIPQLIGSNLFLQGLAVDPGQNGLPFVVSDARRYTVPGDPTLPVVAHIYEYPSAAGTPIFGGPFNGGVVARFEY